MGKSIAIAITAFAGTWVFLFLHIIWWTIWIGFGVEPFPYGLLTMILSLEAIVLGTLILMGQNLAAKHDAEQAKLDRDRAKHVEHIAEHLDQVHAHQLTILQHLEALANK